MTKQDILGKLYEKKGAEQDPTQKEQIDNICNIIRLMPEEEIEKTAPEIKSFISDRFSPNIDYNILDTILKKLKDWISHHPDTAECYVLDSMNKRSKRILTIFLAFIGVLAIIAIPFALLNFFMGENFCGGRGDDIANILGTLDFALGAWGFIWERKDDMKKKEIRNASKRIKETGDSKQFINKCIENINFTDNSVHQYGFFVRNKDDHSVHIHKH